MDVLQQFGQLSEDLFEKRKYAKWKAAYIHNCLKYGEQPIPGPPKDRKLLVGESDDEDDEGKQEKQLLRMWVLSDCIIAVGLCQSNVVLVLYFITYGLSSFLIWLGGRIANNTRQSALFKGSLFAVPM